ncbi:MAG: LysM peptidoglycan-binding domain-containing protein, partial [Planctomycetes bacterium]|nr:LysM peptidoglycan-binding domain-containing protein [Planctomycetota bacterium]
RITAKEAEAPSDFITPEIIQYEVRPGDSYEKIANHFGGKDSARQLEKLNKVPPQKLRPGMKLVIPVHVTGVSRTDEGTMVKMAGKWPYKIRRGDTLSQIAEMYLGTIKRIDEIKKLNPGINDSKIREGATIFLPATTYRQP